MFKAKGKKLFEAIEKNEEFESIEHLITRESLHWFGRHGVNPFLLACDTGACRIISYAMSEFSIDRSILHVALTNVAKRQFTVGETAGGTSVARLLSTHDPLLLSMQAKEWDLEGKTPLHVAVINDASDPLKAFLRRREASLHVKDGMGRTPASIAVARGGKVARVVQDFLTANSRALAAAIGKHEEEVVPELLHRGIDVEYRVREGGAATLLTAALAAGEFGVAAMLVAGGVKVQERDVCAALPKCKRGKDTSIIELLVRHGADPTIPGILTAACKHAGCHISALRFIISLGADTIDDDEWPIHELIRAISQESACDGLEKLNVLLEIANMEDVNRLEESSGLAPLHVAVKMYAGLGKCAIPIVMALLSAGADPNLANGIIESRKTPFDVVVGAHAIDLLSTFVEFGANVNSKDVYNISVLHQAIVDNDNAMASALLVAGADPNLADLSDVSPLHAAVQLQLDWAVKLLLKHGVDVNKRNVTGATPLFLAVSKKDVSLARLLLEQRGVDVDACQESGETPLMKAAAFAHLGLVRLLLDNGANPHRARKDKKTAAHLVGVEASKVEKVAHAAGAAAGMGLKIAGSAFAKLRGSKSSSESASLTGSAYKGRRGYGGASPMKLSDSQVIAKLLSEAEMCVPSPFCRVPEDMASLDTTDGAKKCADIVSSKLTDASSRTSPTTSNAESRRSYAAADSTGTTQYVPSRELLELQERMQANMLAERETILTQMHAQRNELADLIDHKAKSSMHEKHLDELDRRLSQRLEEVAERTSELYAVHAEAKRVMSEKRALTDESTVAVGIFYREVARHLTVRLQGAILLGSDMFERSSTVASLIFEEARDRQVGEDVKLLQEVSGEILSALPIVGHVLKVLVKAASMVAERRVTKQQARAAHQAGVSLSDAEFLGELAARRTTQQLVSVLCERQPEVDKMQAAAAAKRAANVMYTILCDESTAPGAPQCVATMLADAVVKRATETRKLPNVSVSKKMIRRTGGIFDIPLSPAEVQSMIDEKVAAQSVPGVRVITTPEAAQLGSAIRGSSTGIARGPCKVCGTDECPKFVPKRGHSTGPCQNCGCFPAKHVRL